MCMQVCNKIIECLALMCILMQNFHCFISHFPQVHKRATECINAHNILEKIHTGDCPKNLLKDNSILQQFKVYVICLFVYFIVYLKYLLLLSYN